MRKLTQRRKAWLLRRAQYEVQRRAHRPINVMGARRATALQVFRTARASLPEANLLYDERPGLCVLRPPADLNFEGNYDESLAFLMDIRGRSVGRPILHPKTGKPLRILTDFAALRTISSGAGLVLAAEIDRRRLVTGAKPRSWDEEWDPAVRAYFEQAGLFELLGIQPQLTSTDSPPTSDLQAVRFIRGRSVRGEYGAALRDRLEALCGKTIGPKRTVYEAISEAIANTRHAYPQDVAIWPTKATGSWWAAGTWNSATDVVSLQLYDQGVGIPATLPRSGHWSDIMKMVGLGERLHPERSDDRLIVAALEVGRTSTGEQGRGKGLAEMASWIDKLGNGFLRITSGRGSITYRSDGETSGTSRRAPFCGTLIEWEIGLGG